MYFQKNDTLILWMIFFVSKNAKKEFFLEKLWSS